LQRKNKGRTEEKAAAALVQEVKALGQGYCPIALECLTNRLVVSKMLIENLTDKPSP